MTLEADAAREGLAVLGGFHPGPEDGAPQGAATILMLGPSGPAFWERFRASPEHADGAPDPLDRWSERVLGALARAHGARALFPFGGPPWTPFTAWARRTGRAWASPVGLLVHETAGLFVSYRGALAFAGRREVPPPGEPPCVACPAPCVTACPPRALTDAGYDVPACRAWLEAEPGRDCLRRGCAVRRACPAGRDLRPEAQSAFHMTSFRCGARA